RVSYFYIVSREEAKRSKPCRTWGSDARTKASTKKDLRELLQKLPEPLKTRTKSHCRQKMQWLFYRVISFYQQRQSRMKPPTDSKQTSLQDSVRRLNLD